MGLTALISFDPDFASPGDWATMYRACGLQVVPSRHPSAGVNWKRPALQEWGELQEAQIPDATFERWYGVGGEHAKRVNMGLITGRASGNIFVIDLDEYKETSALAWWHAILTEHNNGAEPETWQQVTGGGGRQLFFRGAPDWSAPTNRTKLKVDIRGQGGFAVLPPSLHASGNNYAWKPGCAPWERAVFDAPGWLMEAVDKLVLEHGGDKDRTTGERAERTESPGGDYNSFGRREDGREEHMRDIVWASIIDWYRECPLPPTRDASDARMREAYAAYERTTKSRLPGSEPNAIKLEKEGRGHTLFADKWRRAIAQWNDEIAAEAAKPRPGETNDSGAEQPEAKRVIGIPLQSAFPIAETAIPPRDWIIPGLFLRRYLSVLVAPPGSGKSLLTLQLAIAIAVGKSWAGWTVRAPKKVLVINAEDDMDEMRRRLFAAAKTMGVRQEDLEGRVFLAEAPESIVIAKADSKTKTVVRTPLLEELVHTIIENGIEVGIVDPFAETFEGDENSNSEIKWAGILWREVARRTSSSILLVHHTKKYAGGMAGDADASRGGGALIGTARIIATLFAMTEDEASILNVAPEDRTKYVRFDDAKANLSLITGRAKWFEKKSVTLNNATGFAPGDEVGVLAPWEPPGMLDGVSMYTVGQILDTIDRGLTNEQGLPTGQYYTAAATSSNKERWAGAVIVRLLGCEEKRAKQILNEWSKNEVLETFDYDDPVARKPRKGCRSVLNNRPDRAPS